MKETKPLELVGEHGSTGVGRLDVEYDHEGCFARIFTSEGQLIGSAYAYAKSHGTWTAAREAAVAEASGEASALLELGPRPESTSEPWPPVTDAA